MKPESTDSADGPIVNVALFYLKEGSETAFEKLRARGGVLLEKYGARIERVIKPHSIAAGELELPDEIHFAVYPNQAALNHFNVDPDFLKLKEEFVSPSVERMEGFVTHLSDFEFTRDMGDSSKTYGVALVYLKPGKRYKKRFDAYHQEACEIIPEFGAHFERFLIPFDGKGSMDMPDEIHRFYFDTTDGMKNMVNDSRMERLFPERDASLRNLVFIVGEALQ